MIFNKILEIFDIKNKEIYHEIAKFNISLIELESAVEFAKTNSTNKNKTITMEVRNESGIGSTILVSDQYNGKQTDITDINGW